MKLERLDNVLPVGDLDLVRPPLTTNSIVYRETVRMVFSDLHRSNYADIELFNEAVSLHSIR